VVIPVIFKSVNVLGAFVTAASIVAVVVASREAMFCSCLALLITDVPSIVKAFAVVTPVTLRLSRFPTEVRDDARMPDPNVVDERTFVLLIL